MAKIKKSTPIKGFKMFDSDWKCRGFQYEVGKSYNFEGEIELCSSGFHFCQKLEDCFKNYDCVTWNRIAEIEAWGNIEECADKCVCDNIKILKEIKFNEISNFIKNNIFDGVNWSNGVNSSYGVNWSKGVNESCGVNWSKGVNESNGVNWSKGVNESNGVNESYGVNWSNGVNGSHGVNESDGVNKSNGVNSSCGVNESNGVNSSDGVNWSKGVNESYGVNWSCGVNSSFGILNSFGVDNALFLANKKRSYSIFGKEIDKEKFEKIYDEFFKKLNGWTPTFNNLKSLYLKYGSEWKLTPIPKAKEISKEEAWRDMPIEAIEFLKSLDEFDPDMFFEITGIKT